MERNPSGTEIRHSYSDFIHSLCIYMHMTSCCDSLFSHVANSRCTVVLVDETNSPWLHIPRVTQASCLVTDYFSLFIVELSMKFLAVAFVESKLH